MTIQNIFYAPQVCTYLPLAIELVEILCAGGGGGGAPLIPPLVWSGDGAGGRGCECRDDGGGGGFRVTSFVTNVSLLGGGGGGCEWGRGAVLQRKHTRRHVLGKWHHNKPVIKIS